MDADRGAWVPTLDVNLKAGLVGVQLAARAMKPGDNGEARPVGHDIQSRRAADFTGLESSAGSMHV